MGKKKAPTISFPGPTATEKQIQQLQLQLMQQQMTRGDQSWEMYNQDRQRMLGSLETLTNGRALTQDEINLINNLSGQYSTMLNEGINSGIVGQQLDRSRQNSIADLVERGVLQSTTGREVLGDIEKERSRLIGDASNQGALMKLQLEKEFRQNATNADLARAQILAGVSGQLGGYTNQLANSAGNIGELIRSANQSERANQFNAKMSNYQMQQLGGGGMRWGGILGGAIGGGLLGPLGAGIGSTLGGALPF